MEADVDDPHEASQWEDDTSAIAAATSASMAINANDSADRTSNPDANPVTDDSTRIFSSQQQQQSGVGNMFRSAVRVSDTNRNSGITSGLAALSLAGGNRESTPAAVAATTNGTTISSPTPTPNASSPLPAMSSSPPEPSASASATVRPRPILPTSNTAPLTTAETAALAAAVLTGPGLPTHHPHGSAGAEAIPQDGPLTPRNDVGPFVLDGAGSGPSVASANGNGNAAGAGAGAGAGDRAAATNDDATERRRSSVAGLAQAMFGRRASADQSPWRR